MLMDGALAGALLGMLEFLVIFVLAKIISPTETKLKINEIQQQKIIDIKKARNYFSKKIVKA